MRPPNAVLLRLLPLLALAGCSLTQPVLQVVEVGEVPRPNKIIERKTVWAKARPITVMMRPSGATAGPGLPLEIRAIHDGRAISFLATWPDATDSSEREEWVWDPQGRRYWHIETPTDMFAIKFPLTGSEKACMMSGEEGTSDVWMWRGGWTHITGIADDMRLIITRGGPEDGLNAQAYPLNAKDGSRVYIQWQNDAGVLPYEPVPRPTEHSTKRVRGMRARHGDGSAVDVLTEEVYEDAHWNLEIWRLLVTGNEDDYQFKGKGPHPFSLAISNDGEGAEHLTSQMLNLRLK